MLVLNSTYIIYIGWKLLCLGEYLAFHGHISDGHRVLTEKASDTYTVVVIINRKFFAVRFIRTGFSAVVQMERRYSLWPYSYS